MEHQPRRINDFFQEKCICYISGGGGSELRCWGRRSKGVVKKNLLVAMDIRRVEYPGGFFVFFLVYVRSHPSLLTRSTSDPALFNFLLLLFLRYYYVRCVHNKNNFERFNGRKL